MFRIDKMTDSTDLTLKDILPQSQVKTELDNTSPSEPDSTPPILDAAHDIDTKTKKVKRINKKLKALGVKSKLAYKPIDEFIKENPYIEIPSEAFVREQANLSPPGPSESQQAAIEPTIDNDTLMTIQRLYQFLG